MMFDYVAGSLSCGQIPLRDLAQEFGTPLYVYSAERLRANVACIKSAFAAVDPLICFAVKANGNLAVLKWFHDLGLGFDIVSGGELHRALRAGGNPSQMAFAGVAKTDAELDSALEVGCGWICVESLDELHVLQKKASEENQPQKVLIRLNPNITPETHHHIITGSAESKFGITVTEIQEIKKRDWSPLHLCGLHHHIGSQIFDPQATLSAMEIALQVLSDCPHHWDTLDLGGGFPVAYHPDDEVLSMDRFAQPLIERLSDYPRQLKVIIEPGRSLVADTAVLLVEVQSEKQTGAFRTLTVDGGMNTLLRPALYDAYHHVLPIEKSEKSAPIFPTHVAGPICESSDYLARDRQLPTMNRGDCLALLTVGAYGYSMASHYNAHPRPAEVLVDGDSYRLIRQRETYADLDRMDCERE